MLASARCLLHAFEFFHSRVRPAMICWTMGQQAFNAAMILTLSLLNPGWTSPAATEAAEAARDDYYLVHRTYATFVEMHHKGIHKLAGVASSRLSAMLMQLHRTPSMSGFGRPEPPREAVDSVMGSTGMMLLEDPGLQGFINEGFSPLSFQMAGGQLHSVGVGVGVGVSGGGLGPGTGGAATTTTTGAGIGSPAWAARAAPSLTGSSTGSGMGSAVGGGGGGDLFLGGSGGAPTFPTSTTTAAAATTPATTGFGYGRDIDLGPSSLSYVRQGHDSGRSMSLSTSSMGAGTDLGSVTSMGPSTTRGPNTSMGMTTTPVGPNVGSNVGPSVGPNMNVGMDMSTVMEMGVVTGVGIAMDMNRYGTTATTVEQQQLQHHQQQQHQQQHQHRQTSHRSSSSSFATSDSDRPPVGPKPAALRMAQTTMSRA